MAARPLEGIQPADAAAILPRKKGVTINARLLARLERKSGDKSAKDTNSKLAKAGFKPEIIQAQVRRLRKLVAGLEWKTTKTAWTEYDDNNRGYGEPDLEAKKAFVAQAAERVQPDLAWDLGANDGAFSSSSRRTPSSSWPWTSTTRRSSTCTATSAPTAPRTCCRWWSTCATPARPAAGRSPSAARSHSAAGRNSPSASR